MNYFEKFFNKFKDISEIQAVVKDYLDGKQEIRKGINKVIYLQELAKIKDSQGKPSPAEELKKKQYASINHMETRFKSYQKPEKPGLEDLRQNSFHDSKVDKSAERKVLMRLRSNEKSDEPPSEPKEQSSKGLRESFARASSKDFFPQPNGLNQKRPIIADRETRIEFTIKEHSITNLSKPLDQQTRTDRIKTSGTITGQRLSKVQSQSSLFRTKASSGNLSQQQLAGGSKQGRRPENGPNISGIDTTEVSRGSQKRSIQEGGAQTTAEASQYLSRVSLPFKKGEKASQDTQAQMRKTALASFMRKTAVS